MTAAWVRRDYSAIGVTQSPPGPHLRALQSRYTGKVLLCIDVSGSMSGHPLRQAVAGAREFFAEAVAAHYDVGLILWSDSVVTHVPLSAETDGVSRALDAAHIVGGTNVTPCLELGIRDLGPLTGDRVMAVFGDGDIGNVKRAKDAAGRAAALGIRIIVRGLGTGAARSLEQIATEHDGPTVIESADAIRTGIASMARHFGLRASS
jgi:predicted metal-dependent peptidase